MKPPPRALYSPDRQRPDGKNLRARLRGTGEGEWDRKARRQVLVQCDACGDKGSGTINPAGALVSANLPFRDARADAITEAHKRWRSSEGTESENAMLRRLRDAQSAPRALLHNGCGGQLVPFDIADDAGGNQR